MSIQDLPSELILNIYQHSDSINTVLRLSSTCHRFQTILRTSQRIPILFGVAAKQYGPLSDALQLLTYNASEPAHSTRTPVLSLALLAQVTRVGQVAARFEEHYINYRWGSEQAQYRRFLTPAEGHKLRRAILRIWLFAVAFHAPYSARTMRMHPSLVADRCQLLRNWSNEDLLDIEDVRLMLESMAADLVPTYGEVGVRRRGYEAFSTTTYNRYHSSPLSSDLFHDSRASVLPMNTCTASEQRQRYMEASCDDIEQSYLIADLLKLSPGRLIAMYDKVRTKAELHHFIDETAGGALFWDNGEVLLPTLAAVLQSRGLDFVEMQEKIYMGRAGIAVGASLGDDGDFGMSYVA